MRSVPSVAARSARRARRARSADRGDDVVAARAATADAKRSSTRSSALHQSAARAVVDREVERLDVVLGEAGGLELLGDHALARPAERARQLRVGRLAPARGRRARGPAATPRVRPPAPPRRRARRGRPAAARGASRAARSPGRPSACSPSGTARRRCSPASRSMLVSASICLKRTLPIPSSSARRCAACSISGAKSEEISVPPGCDQLGGEEAGVAGAGARARAASGPGCGSIASIIQAETGIVARAQRRRGARPSPRPARPSACGSRVRKSSGAPPRGDASAGPRGGPCPTPCAAARRRARTPSAP